MKEISQEEFEQRIQDVIDGKYTRADLIKELRIDRVTLNNKIQELYVSNQKLYFQFIAKFPYKPREYSHIDYEAMLIDIMKKGYKKVEIKEQYGIHNRTVARKIYEVEKTNPGLVELYRKVAAYRQRKKPLPKELQEQVDSLELREVFIGGIYDKREKELLEKERKYNETKAAGISDTKAYGQKRTIKDLSTLYRLEIEQLAIPKNPYTNGENSIHQNNKGKELGDSKDEEGR